MEGGEEKKIGEEQEDIEETVEETSQHDPIDKGGEFRFMHLRGDP